MNITDQVRAANIIIANMERGRYEKARDVVILSRHITKTNNVLEAVALSSDGKTPYQVWIDLRDSTCSCECVESRFGGHASMWGPSFGGGCPCSEPRIDPHHRQAV